MIIISTSLTVSTQPSPRFHVEAWLVFRNCEMDYLVFRHINKVDKVDHDDPHPPETPHMVIICYTHSYCTVGLR